MMNLDRSCSEHIPSNCGPEGAGDGLLRSLTGRPIGAHKVLCNAAEIACMGRQDFNLGHGCGNIIPSNEKSLREIRKE